MTRDAPTRRIKSVRRACLLLIHLREEGETTVTELAEEFDLSPGTIHTYLATLREAGFVEQHGDEYRLSLELLPLGERVRMQHPLYQAARDEVDRLAHACDGVAHLLIEYEGQLLILYEVFSEKAVGRDFHARKRDQPQEHIHCTAGGKAILSRLSAEKIHDIVETQGLPVFTDKTISETSRLFDELEKIREEGYALNDEEQMRGIRAVGAPIVDSKNGIIGALSVSGPATNWRSSYFHEELPDLVTRSANNTEINLQSNLDRQY
ncbi:IclR family transcriptional regulator [Halobacterium sp. R2-5]|uniref:IclR family transcriptional regulator n=1 Tax=Halobacterium sp. R2-5 TaxID=2715751 RepID=UPI001420AAE2|nr:IclR family transcriptional regulator [Halobacterium sp. R2-5]NIC00975.1 IclR family transcriptional regulator [Halobacterium sp. R2-5]